MRKGKNNGFTLVELLLSVALISALAAISVPVYRTLISKNDLAIAASTFAQSTRRAQALSQAVDGDSTWGVSLQSGQVIIFKGVNYAGRDVNFDEIYNISTTIGFSGVTEIVFNKLTGEPVASGVTTLTNQSDTKTVTSNAKGMVSYQ